MPIRIQRTVVAQVDSDIEIRTETLFGREFTVVPVVAMVEGVRFGAAQTDPELGLASEFGENPELWNNRPLVMNHPKVDGNFVSANSSPEVLEEYYFGITMNAKLDDTKLKMEAWFDNARIEELGGEFEETLEKIKDQELVEVSVGFYSDLEPKKGKFKGQSYKGIWRNIRPDHLAILSEGMLGACSNADGCGIPRINKESDMAKQLATGEAVKTGCSCGGTHTQEEHTDEEVVEGATPKTQKSKSGVPLLNPLKALEEEAAEERAAIRELNQKIVDQQIDSSLMDSDVRKLLNRALAKQYGSYSYVYGFTNEYVIFEKYNYSAYGEYSGYVTYRQNINVTEGAVEFVGDPEEVVLLTKIVPQSQAESEQLTTATVQTQENDMTKANDTTATGATGTTPEATATTTPAATTETTQTPAVQEKKLTAQEYIENAPAEVREVLQSSLKMHQDRKAECIKTLKAHPKNKFSDEHLSAQSLDVLENMVELIGATPSYAGVAPASAPRVHNEGAQIIEAPRVFERKSAAA